MSFHSGLKLSNYPFVLVLFFPPRSHYAEEEMSILVSRRQGAPVAGSPPRMTGNFLSALTALFNPTFANL